MKFSLGDNTWLESRKQRRGFIIWTCLFFLLVTLVYGWPILFGGQALAGGDIVNSYLPYKFLAKQQLLQGEFPHWNPLVFCGRPLQADIQVGLFYPPNLLFWFMPLEWAFNLTTLFHFWIGGVGMALWMRRRVTRAAAAWLAGVLFMFSGYATTRLIPGIVVFHYAMAWLPWLLLCWDRLVESFSHRYSHRHASAIVALVLVAVLELLAGAPQIAFYSFVALGLYAVILAWRGRGDITSEDDDLASSPLAGLREWLTASLPFELSHLLFLALALALAAGICAIQLLPTSMLIGQSWDRAVGASWDYIVDGSLHPRMLLTFFAPFFFGDPRNEELYWGGSVGYFETTAYATALPIFLLAIFFAARWGGMRRVWATDLPNPRRRDAVRFEIFLLCLLGIAVLFSFGRYSPFFWLAYHFVPGFDRFRVPARMLLFYVLAASALSGWTLDRLMASDFGNAAILRIRRSAAARVILIIGIIGAALTILLYRSVPSLLQFFKMPFLPFEQMPHDPRFHMAAILRSQAGHSILFFLLQWVVAAMLILVISGALIASSKMFRIQRIALWLGLFGCLAVLLPYGLHFMVTQPLSKLRVTEYPRTDRIAFLQEALRDGGRFLWFDSLLSYQVDQFQPELLTNRPIMHNLPSLRGYDPINSRRYGLFINQMTHQPLWQNPRAFMFVPDAPPAPTVDWRLMSLLDTRIALSYADFQNPAVAELKNWYFTEPGMPAPATMHAYRLQSPSGPAWISAPFVVEPETPLEEMLALLGDPKFNPKAMAIVEGDPYLETARRFVSGNLSPLAIPKIILTKSRFGSLSFKTSLSSARFLLIVSQSYYPGWRAWVDGHATPVIPANVTLCAIPLSPGEHEVEMAFRPRQFYQGAAISAASLILLALVLLKRRRQS